MTKFFEPISASATHIYHSALELCPKSSIVRKLYYHRSRRITLLPRVLIGTPESWDPTISISSKNNYRFCTWSPCGRFIVALTGNTVEIRNQLTLELLTTLQPKESTLLSGPLAYSPDGRSLACASDTAIVVWDIQTGGVAREIECGANMISLVWSLDGRRIGTLESLSPDTREMITCMKEYDVASATQLFIRTIHSNHKPQLWAYEDTFRIMTMKHYPFGRSAITIKIDKSEVRSPLGTTPTSPTTTQAQSEDTSISYTPGSEIISYSPTARLISVSMANRLAIFRDSDVVIPLDSDLCPGTFLREEGHFISPCFSPNGSFFAAFRENDVYVWEYHPRHHFMCKMLWPQDQIDSLQFSPTSSSLLSHSGNILRVSNLDHPSTIPKSCNQKCAALSRSGSLITVKKHETTITINKPHLQHPWCFINTSTQVNGLLLTGDVLLVVGSDRVAAWLLKEEGSVRRVLGTRTLDYDDCIWAESFTRPSHDNNTRPTVASRGEGKTCMIEHDDVGRLIYHTATGEIIPSVQTPPRLSGPGLNITEEFCGRHRNYFHNLSRSDTTPDCWHPSEAALGEGWIKDPQGRHRLWLDVEWRKSWDLADWCHDIMAQFSIVGGQLVIVKF